MPTTQLQSAVENLSPPPTLLSRGKKWMLQSIDIDSLLATSSCGSVDAISADHFVVAKPLGIVRAVGIGMLFNAGLAILGVLAFKA